MTQNIYNEILKKIKYETIKCENCYHVGFNIHCKYSRHVKNKNGKLKICITRIICPKCGKTHAILLSCIVPWSQITVEDNIQIIKTESEKDIRDLLDVYHWISIEDIKNVKKRYRNYWKERIKSHDISLDGNISETCIEHFKRQFMQIKCCIAYLICIST